MRNVKYNYVFRPAKLGVLKLTMERIGVHHYTGMLKKK